MDFVYTIHAQEKFEERKLSKNLIEETVESPDKVTVSRFGRKIAQKTVKNKLFRVVYEQEDSLYIIITAYYAEVGRY